MTRKILNFLVERTFYWCGIFFASQLIVFAIYRILLHCKPGDLTVYIFAGLCSLFFVVDLLAFVGKLTARLDVRQDGHKLYITKGDCLVATVILKDEHPLTEEETAQILEDVFRLRDGGL